MGGGIGGAGCGGTSGLNQRTRRVSMFFKTH